MAKGGKRIGAGRPKGKSDKSIIEIRGILNNYSEELLMKAYEMAMGGNERMLAKLLDKVLPNLNSVDMSSGSENKRPFEIRLIKTKPDGTITN